MKAATCDDSVALSIGPWAKAGGGKIDVIALTGVLVRHHGIGRECGGYAGLQCTSADPLCMAVVGIKGSAPRSNFRGQVRWRCEGPDRSTAIEQCGDKGFDFGYCKCAAESVCDGGECATFVNREGSVTRSSGQLIDRQPCPDAETVICGSKLNSRMWSQSVPKIAGAAKQRDSCATDGWLSSKTTVVVNSGVQTGLIDPRQNAGVGRKARECAARPERGLQRQCRTGLVIVMNRQSQLFQIIQATDASGCFPGFLDSRQQQGNQNGNNGNHDQQFNEGKSASKCWLGHGRGFGLTGLNPAGAEGSHGVPVKRLMA